MRFSIKKPATSLFFLILFSSFSFANEMKARGIRCEYWLLNQIHSNLESSENTLPDTSVELELTVDETTLPIIQSIANPELQGASLARLLKKTGREEFLLNRMAHQILSERKKNPFVINFKKCPDFCIRPILDLTVKKPTSFLNETLAPGIHQIRTTKFLSHKLEWSGPSRMLHGDGIEIHLRTNKGTAGQVSGWARTFLKLLGTEQVNQHVHLVKNNSQLPHNVSVYYSKRTELTRLIEANPQASFEKEVNELEQMLIANSDEVLRIFLFYLRVSKFLEMHSLFENGRNFDDRLKIYSYKNSLGKMVRSQYIPFSFPRREDIRKTFEMIFNFARGANSAKEINQNISLKAGMLGFHWFGKYDKFNTWGIEVRSIPPNYREKVIGTVLDSIQNIMITDPLLGLPKDLPQWFYSYWLWKKRTYELSDKDFNHGSIIADQWFTTSPPLLNGLSNSNGHLVALLSHQWITDIIFWSHEEQHYKDDIVRISKLQSQYAQKFLKKYDSQSWTHLTVWQKEKFLRKLVRQFLWESGIYQAYAASLGIGVSRIPRK